MHGMEPEELGSLYTYTCTDILDLSCPRHNFKMSALPFSVPKHLHCIFHTIHEYLLYSVDEGLSSLGSRHSV